MINGKRVLAVVPARGGSKGVPGKNVRVVGGKPLIVWTIEAARAASHIDRLVVSSDDDAIIAAARAADADVPFRRPAHLATDSAATIDVVFHALDQLPGFEFVVLLQPTSPMRSSADIDAALECCIRADAPACVSVAEAEQSPYWMFNLDAVGHLRPLLGETHAASRRQDLPPVYVLNGAVYVANCAWLRQARSFVTPETVAYLMPPARSVDIDTELDMIAFESLSKELSA